MKTINFLLAITGLFLIIACTDINESVYQRDINESLTDTISMTYMYSIDRNNACNNIDTKRMCVYKFRNTLYNDRDCTSPAPEGYYVYQGAYQYFDGDLLEPATYINQ